MMTQAFQCGFIVVNQGDHDIIACSGGAALDNHRVTIQNTSVYHGVALDA